MSPIMLEHRASHPLHTLFTVFLSWKALILAITLASSVTGPSYDTSTTLALGRDEATSAGSLTTRLTRWDAIYFTSAAHIGRVYEQEYAFGSGLPALVALIARIPRALGLAAPDDPGVEASIAIVIAHAAHLGAVFALYELTRTLFANINKAKPSAGGSTSQDIAFFAALVHIISPAGVFLSAGYQEAPFACLSFLGFLLLAKATRRSDDGISSTGLLHVAAGAAFGLATLFRTNGLLNGVPFAAECVRVVLEPLLTGEKRLPRMTGLIGPVIGGLLVAAGSVVPQAAAYRRYCSGASEPRVWCGRSLPSIYSFVQEHHWGVGFLRYWTLNNLPLFLLAAPVLAIMIRSGIDVIRQPSWLSLGETQTTAGAVVSSKGNPKPKAETPGCQTGTRARILVVSMAASQVLIAVLALAQYHVQIITRLASGYPVWCWWLAGCLLSADRTKKVLGERIVVFGVMYALIQTALFACFLPPA